MDTAQWPQEIVVKPMEEIIGNTNSTSKSNSVERKARPQKEQAVNCPRCNSTNTKFCYYNNYSLSQPRYFCKTCKRYWTEGGSLRNIPVGGGSRKNKKSPLNSNNNINNSSSNPLKKLPDLVQNPSKIHIDGSQDLNLGFSSDFKTITDLIQVPNYDSNNNKDMNSPSTISSRGLSHHNSFMHMPIMSGFSMPSLNFSLDDGLGTTSAYENHHHLQETTNGRFLFPFVGLKQVQNTTTTAEGTTQHQHNDRDHSNGESTTNGYWNGMLGGGGSW